MEERGEEGVAEAVEQQEISLLQSEKLIIEAKSDHHTVYGGGREYWNARYSCEGP
jgi:hypothetical protein